jgi:hypothetical protein
MTKEQSQEIVLMLTANWPNFKASHETVALYEKIIAALPVADTQAVVMEIISTSEAEFMPKPAFIARKVAERQLAAKGHSVMSGEEAWKLVQDAIRQIGYYGYPSGLNALVRAAVDALDWKEICTNENIEATRAHFFRIYDSTQQRLVQSQLAATVGQELGWRDESPKQIADRGELASSVHSLTAGIGRKVA